MGVDPFGSAPGGIATASNAIISGFSRSSDIAISPIVNFKEGTTAVKLSKALGAIWNVVRNHRGIDIVHIQVAHGLSIERDLPLALVARAMKMPVVTYFHGAGQREDFENGSLIHRLAYRLLLRCGTNIFLGPNSLNFFRQVDKKCSVRVIPNGVALSSEHASPFPTGIPTIIFVGRLGERKGTDDLLSAIEILAKRGLSFRAIILGDGEVDAIQQRVESNVQLSEVVEILGWKDHQATLEFIRQAWVLVLPSYAEGLPLAVLEAMACGRAVIVSSVGEVDSVINDRETGFLIEAGNISQLADVIEEATADPDRLRTMGELAFDIVREKFSTDVMLKLLRETYCSLLP